MACSGVLKPLPPNKSYLPLLLFKKKKKRKEKRKQRKKCFTPPVLILKLFNLSPTGDEKHDNVNLMPNAQTYPTSLSFK